MTHLNYSLKKLRKTFELEKELLKTEMNHDEVYADTWKNKKNEWLKYVRTMFYLLLFHTLDIVNQCRKKLGLV